MVWWWTNNFPTHSVSLWATAYQSPDTDSAAPHMATMQPPADGNFKHKMSQSTNHCHLISSTWQWVARKGMTFSIYTCNFSESRLWCGKTGGLDPGCAASKCAANAGWYLLTNMSLSYRVLSHVVISETRCISFKDWKPLYMWRKYISLTSLIKPSQPTVNKDMNSNNKFHINIIK